MRRAATAFLLLILAGQTLATPARPASNLAFDANGSHRFSAFQVASDGTDFLVLSGSRDTFQIGPLFTQRVIGGKPAGPRRQIGSGAPAGLAWNGTDFLAAWRTTAGLWVAPVSREGTLRSIPAAPVVNHTGVSLFAAGLHGAMAFLYNENSVTLQPLDPNGNPSRPPVTHMAPAFRANISVAATPNGFAAVFTGFHGTWAMLFRADGTSITTSPILLDGPYEATSSGDRSTGSLIATDGTDTLILFSRGKSNTLAELRSVVLSATGTVKSTQQVHSIAGGDAHHILVAGLVWDGTQYVAATNIVVPDASFRRAGFLRIGRNGAASGALSWLHDEARPSYSYTLSTNGRRLFAPISLNESLQPPLRAVSIDPATLRVAETVTLGRTLSPQTTPTIAAGKGGYLAAWYESSAEGTTVRASRVDAQGNYLDGDGIVLDTIEPFSNDDRTESIAIDADGPQWFVVWRSGWNIRGVSISHGGVPARRGPVNLDFGTAADILWTGSHYILLRAGDGLYKDVISANGTVLETTVLAQGEELRSDDPLGYGYRSYREPALVVAGGHPTAVFTKQESWCWMGTPGGCADDIDVMTLRLDTPGAIPITIAEDTWGGVSAASDATQALVMWQGYTGTSAAFIAANGQPGTPFLVAAEAGVPSVAHDGNGFVATWVYRSPAHSLATARITSNGVTGEKTTMPHANGPRIWQTAIAARAGLPPLIAFTDQHEAYDSVRRLSLLFAHEFDVPDAVPSAPTIVCATTHGDGTISVRWLPVQNALGVSLELRLSDGTFRRIGVAPADATSARVSKAGLEGTAVRIRAWNLAGTSDPSAIATSSTQPSASIAAPSMRVCAGAPVTIRMSLRGTAPFTVRWSDGVVQSNLSANATRVVTVSRNTTLKIVSVSDSSCGIDETEHAIDLVVERGTSIAEQSGDVRIARGATATLNIVASGETSVEWFEGNVGDTTKRVATNTTSFTTPALTATTRYWARVSNRCGHTDSAPMTVTVVAASGKKRAVR